MIWTKSINLPIYIFLVIMSAYECVLFTKIKGRENLRVNDSFSLLCSVDVYASNIVIDDPKLNSVLCTPPGIFPPSCGGAAGFTPNETEKTVTLEKNASLDDDGLWTCTYSTLPPISHSLNVSVIKLDQIPSRQTHIILQTSALNGSTIDKTSNDNFTVVFGCISKKVTIRWELSPSLFSWTTETTSSTLYPCTTNTQLYSYTISAKEVFAYLNYGTSNLQARVFYLNEELAIGDFDVTFNAGKQKICSDLYKLLALLCLLDVIAFIVLLYRKIKKIEQLDNVEVESIAQNCCGKWIFSQLPVECVVMLVIKCIQAVIIVPILIVKCECPVGPVIGIAIALIVGCTAIYVGIFWIVIWCVCRHKIVVNRVDSEITKEYPRKSINGDAGPNNLVSSNSRQETAASAPIDPDRPDPLCQNRP